MSGLTPNEDESIENPTSLISRDNEKYDEAESKSVPTIFSTIF